MRCAPATNAETVNAGLELSWNEILFLRGGRKAIFMADSQEGFTAGAGARVDLSAGTALGFDYGYEDFGLFGGIQTFALSVTF